ncbi:hypothetical protein PCA31118_01794 [Pandoraea captiosa]|uniref:MarR family transcriptional regulator n=1 Tax=Pandoraea captiosa TaxID=2508302 RepID=A0A5E4ZU06_9BURK|nr:DUF488 family protein [Pandoraea captiosa]VVE64794.1 hypothetical protein PCA31118_01794 [Pandoraea captiosa]
MPSSKATATTRAKAHAAANDKSATPALTDAPAGKRSRAPFDIRFKRAYDAPDPADGQRILADRLWPRGLAKVKTHIDFWAKDATPSTTLRKWFHEHPEQFDAFRQRFLAELASLDADQNATLQALRTRVSEGTVTLLTAAHRLEDDEAHTHLHVLRDFLASRR